MAERIRTQKPVTSKKASEEASSSESVYSKSADDLKAELDEMLDEIDEVLEENAETFVKHYVQKGGQ